MSDSLSENGLSVQSYDELLNFIQSSLNEIYAVDGEEINFDSNTPDAQFTNILAQTGSDVRELIQEVYNSFDPSKCSGVLQDSRYALNYIERQGGTFTIQNIDVTVDKTVTLQGLDDNYNDLNATSYTVSDDIGNLWYLIDTVTLEKGTHSLPFRYQNYGLVQPTIGTITNQVTIVLGVVSVNNSIAPTTLGRNQESDFEFRLRRERSTALRGQNNLDAMEGQLLELDDVVDVRVHNNPSQVTDETGTPPLTIWVIVEGGSSSDIANVIYANSCGLPTKGSITVDVETISGKDFPVSFDRANPVPLYIKFDFKAIVDLSAVDFDAIKETIGQNLTYGLDETAQTARITDIAQDAIVANGAGGYALNVQISTDGINWTNYIPSASLQDKFVVDTTRITINAI